LQNAMHSTFPTTVVPVQDNLTRRIYV
jgi:hypothetical protein